MSDVSRGKGVPAATNEIKHSAIVSPRARCEALDHLGKARVIRPPVDALKLQGWSDDPRGDGADSP